MRPMQTIERRPAMVIPLSPVQNFLFGHSRAEVVYDCLR